MRLLAWKALRDYYLDGHPDAELSLKEFYKRVSIARWSNFADLKKDFPSADRAGDYVVFDINGNKHRLICDVLFDGQAIYVKFIGTHADYDRYLKRNR